MREVLSIDKAGIVALDDEGRLCVYLKSRAAWIAIEDLWKWLEQLERRIERLEPRPYDPKPIALE